MTTPAPSGELRRLRLGFGVSAVIGAVAGAAVAIGAASFPRGHFGWGLWAVGLFGLAATAWLVAAALALAVRHVSVVLLVPPAILAVTVSAAGLDLPLRARFAAARPAFEQTVADRGEAGPGAPCPGRIGSYGIIDCTTTSSITRFYTVGGFLEVVGFAYAPEGVPAATARGAGDLTYERLTGPWYTFSDSF